MKTQARRTLLWCLVTAIVCSCAAAWLTAAVANGRAAAERNESLQIAATRAYGYFSDYAADADETLYWSGVGQFAHFAALVRAYYDDGGKDADYSLMFHSSYRVYKRLLHGPAAVEGVLSEFLDAMKLLAEDAWDVNAYFQLHGIEPGTAH